MKQVRFSLLLLIVVITGSCKKVPVLDWVNPNISFKADGAPKEARGDKNVFAIYAKDETILQIVGNIDAAGDEQIALLINNFHGVGEYTAEEDFLGIYNSPDVESSIVGTEGTIKITEYIEGKSIKGEFQFKGEALIVIPDPNAPPVIKIVSEGKFVAKVTNHSGPILPD